MSTTNRQDPPIDKQSSQTKKMSFTEQQIKQFVDDWYLKLDVHAPVAEVLPLLSSEIEMQLPETTLHGLDQFKTWYDRVIHTFFDEVHEMQKLDINIASDRADLELVVRWEASRWNAPAPQSDRLRFDAAQRWVIKRSHLSEPAIVTYIVDSLTPLEGSANL
jgi:hypothetical protein